MKKLLLTIVFLGLTGTASFAQQARVKRYTTPKCGEIVLQDVDDKYNAQIYSMELPEPDAMTEQKKLSAIKKLVAAKFPRQRSAAAKKTTTVMQPVIDISYVADSFSGIPPDNYTAINNNDTAVCVMNDRIAIHNALTGAFVTIKSLESFTAPEGLLGSVNYRYDPKIVYDPQADRFIFITLNGIDQNNYILIAFSKTNNPTGGWNFYKFYGDYAGDTTWFDYPAISVTQNEVFFTGNKIKNDSSWQAGFTQSVIYQIRKADGYNGNALLNYQLWDSVTYNNKYIRCLYPLNPGDGVQGPGQYFLSNRDFAISNDTTFLMKVPDTIGSGNTAFTVIPLVAAQAYGVPPDGRQPDTSLTLATNDNRVLGGFVAGNEVQFVCTTVNPATGGSAVYHGIISNYNTTPSLQAQIFSIDTLDFGYPNISYAGNAGGNNQSIISFDYTGPNTFPGYGAIFYDGTGYSDMLNIKSGFNSINMLSGKEQRWGDYSGSQPLWKAPGVVWVEGIYGRQDQQYGNYTAELSSPYFTGVPALPAPTNATSGNVYPNPAWNYISFEFTVVTPQEFSFVIYDAQGKMVDKLIDKYCEDGKNVIEFNVGPLAPGTYLLKAAGHNGENLPAHTFVRK